MLLWLLFGLAASFDEVLHKRFEYKHSFKGPSLTDAAAKVPFWDASGSCMPSTDYVRVTPSIRSKQGQIWNKLQYVGNNWEIQFSIKVQGRGKLGADGMAIWYVQELPKRGGSVFGSPNNWRGLGIFFDSFDNDNKHDNPAVIAVVNDGTITFDHGKDGKGQEVASCIQGFRNRPHPTQVRLRYYQQVLTLEVNPGITTREADFETCFRKENVKLAPGGFFGVTAATGALADDHDVHKFMTYSLFERTEQATPLTDETKQKILTDYEKYDVALEEKKKKYKEKNPDKYSQVVEDEQNLFYKSLIDYQVKLSEKFDQLGNVIKELINVGNTDDTAVIKASVSNLEKMQNNLGEMIESNGAQMQNVVTKMEGLNKKSQNSEKDLKTLSLALGAVQTQLKEIHKRKTHACPAIPEQGITFIHLFCLIVIQTSLLLGYWVWRSRVEEARKKFF